MLKASTSQNISDVSYTSLRGQIVDKHERKMAELPSAIKIEALTLKRGLSASNLTRTEGWTRFI